MGTIDLWTFSGSLIQTDLQLSLMGTRCYFCLCLSEEQKVVLEQPLGFPPWGQQLPQPPGSRGLSLQTGRNRKNRGNGTFLGTRDVQISPVNPASTGRARRSHGTQLHPMLMVLGPVRFAKCRALSARVRKAAFYSTSSCWELCQSCPVLEIIIFSFFCISVWIYLWPVY